jgi:hypothetical protein
MTRCQIGRYWLLVAFLVVAVSGCGSGRYRVAGTVTYEDGSPLTEGTVAGEATIDGKLVAVQGNVHRDGSFTWGTEKPCDGAYPGTYRVIVLPRALGDSEISQGMEPDVDPKFTNYQTSGINFEVKAGRNKLDIKVSKPVPRGN